MDWRSSRSERLQFARPSQDGGSCGNCPPLRELSHCGSGSQGRLSGGGETSLGT